MRKLLVLLVIVLLTVIGPVNVQCSGFENNKNASLHWSFDKYEKWKLQNLVDVKKFEEFMPDEPISKPEYISMICKCFGLDYINEKVSGSNNSEFLTRLEAVTILRTVLKLDPGYETELYGKYFDGWKWKESMDVGTALEKGWLTGYPDGTLKMDQHITRAEALSLLYNAAGTICSKSMKADKTTLIDGNLTVNRGGIVLRNLKITGSMYLTAGKGSEYIVLENVTVLGRTLICAEGVKKISVKNCALGITTVDREHENIFIDAHDSTMIGEITLKSPAVITGRGLKRVGIGNVIVKQVKKENRHVLLKGDFGNVTLKSRDTVLDVCSGTVDSIRVDMDTGNSSINLTDIQVEKVILNNSIDINVRESSIHSILLSYEAFPSDIKETGKSFIGNIQTEQKK